VRIAKKKKEKEKNKLFMTLMRKEEIRKTSFFVERDSILLL